MRLWLFLIALVLPLAAQAKRIDLVVPRPGTDLSAYRFDSELFGFSRDGTEMAAVGLEVARASLGRQRGEGFLLVYRAGSALPVRNVIIRAITHPDMPENPLPLDTAAGIMGFLNDDWMNKWSHRPQRRHLPGNMVVEPHVVMLPAPELGAAAVDAQLKDAIVEGFSPKGANQMCTPYVGARLTWHNQRRQTPYIPLDLAARCDLLRVTDKQVAWGRADSAAITVGLAFNSRPVNEESAKFITLARWADAEPVTLALVGATPLDKDLLARVHHTLAPFGPVVKRPPRVGAATGAGKKLVAIEAHERWLALGQYLAEKLGSPDVMRVHQTTDQHTVTFVFGEQAPTPKAVERGPKGPGRTPPSPQSAVQTRRPKQAPSSPPTPEHSGDQATSTFLDDFGKP